MNRDDTGQVLCPRRGRLRAVAVAAALSMVLETHARAGTHAPAPISSDRTDATLVSDARVEPEPSDVSPDASTLEVVVAPGVPRSEAVRERILDDARRLLRAHDIALGGPERKRLTIDVAGEGRELDVTVRVFRDGALVEPAPVPFACECTVEELRGRIDRAVVQVLPTLRDEPEPATSPVPPPTLDSQPTPAPEPEGHRPLGSGGKAGIALVGVGASALIAGVVLLSRAPRKERLADDLQGSYERTRYSPPSIGFISAGVAVLIVGAVLFAADRTRGRRRTSTSTAWRRNLGLRTTTPSALAPATTLEPPR